MRMRMLLALSVMLAHDAMAQGGAGAARPPLNPASPANPAQRARLEQQIRTRMGKRVREALGLNDVQVAKLTELTRRYEEKHRVLQDQERDVRMSLREEVLRADTTRGAQMNALLDRYIRNERQRVDLAEQEQKELAAFLTPLQRAKYFGLQEVIRNQIQNLRQQTQQLKRALPPNGQPPRPGGRPEDLGPNDPGMGPGGPPNPAEPPRAQPAPARKRPQTP